MSALPTMGRLAPDYPGEPTRDQKQRYALRQCFLLAIRMARREQKRDDSRSSEWNHIIRFCQDADVDGDICGRSVLRQSAQGDNGTTNQPDGVRGSKGDGNTTS